MSTRFKFYHAARPQPGRSLEESFRDGARIVSGGDGQEPGFFIFTSEARAKRCALEETRSDAVVSGETEFDPGQWDFDYEHERTGVLTLLGRCPAELEQMKGGPYVGAQDKGPDRCLLTVVSATPALLTINRTFEGVLSSSRDHQFPMSGPVLSFDALAEANMLELLCGRMSAKFPAFREMKKQVLTACAGEADVALKYTGAAPLPVEIERYDQGGKQWMPVARQR